MWSLKFLECCAPTFLAGGLNLGCLVGLLDVPEQDDDKFLVVNLTRYPSCFLVDRMHPLLERRDKLVLDDLHDFPVLSLPDGAFPKIQSHLKGLGLSAQMLE